RRTRKVKVRDEMVDNPKLVQRPNEDACFAAPSANGTVRAGGTLERANTRGSDRPHLPARMTTLLDRISRLTRHRVPLLVHHMLRRIVDFDRLERSRADVQYDFGSCGATRGDLR